MLPMPGVWPRPQNLFTRTRVKLSFLCKIAGDLSPSVLLKGRARSYLLPPMIKPSWLCFGEQNMISFRIGLRILNPNANALTIRGLSYHLDLNGHKVVSGVSGDIPDVPAYGDIVVNFEAGTSLVGGARFVYDLIQSSDGIIDYKLEAKLDVGTFSPAIKLIENGQVSLDP